MSTTEELADSRQPAAQHHTLCGLLDAQRRSFAEAGPPGVADRRHRIDRLLALVLDNTDAFAEAMAADFGTRSKPASPSKPSPRPGRRCPIARPARSRRRSSATSTTG
jgi:coniferyl-aldehyde dehydrogenase